MDRINSILVKSLIDELPLEAALRNKSFLVTGATGLIGSEFVSLLCEISRTLPELNLRIIAHGRSEERLEYYFPRSMNLEFLIGDIADIAVDNQRFDFLVHTAAPTESRYFVEHPVETIETIVLGTRTVLKTARASKATSVVVLSSMETYGVSLTEKLLAENEQYFLDPLSPRSSYPQAKRLIESLCAAYANEYNVPVKTIRLGQVIGRALPPNDKRLIAFLIHSAQSGRNIEFATDGESKQTYLGIDDTLSALFYVLLRGENGCIYNAANEATYCSVKELAKLVLALAPRKTSELHISQQPGVSHYPPTRFLHLDSSALRALGWTPTQNLQQMLVNLIENQ